MPLFKANALPSYLSRASSNITRALQDIGIDQLDADAPRQSLGPAPTQSLGPAQTPDYAPSPTQPVTSLDQLFAPVGGMPRSRTMMQHDSRPNRNETPQAAPAAERTTAAPEEISDVLFPERTEFDHLINASADKHGVERNLVRALIMMESTFRPDAKSYVGAQGLMQLMPETAKELGVTDPFDPAQNIEGGVKYFAQLLKQHEGNVKLAAAAYNAGPGNVARYGGVPPFKETQDYIKKLQGYGYGQ